MSTVTYRGAVVHQPLAVRESAPQIVETYPLVFIANDPASYRSLLANELPFLRPNLRVLEVNPAELDAKVSALLPTVVVCSEIGAHARAAGCSVLVLRTGEIDAILESREGTIVNPRLTDILGAIDRAMPKVPLETAAMCSPFYPV